MPLPEATAITILDWVISVLSIIVFGAIVYVVSPMPRGMGRIPQPADADPAATDGLNAARDRSRIGARFDPIRRTDVPRSGGRAGPAQTGPALTAPDRPGGRDWAP